MSEQIEQQEVIEADVAAPEVEQEAPSVFELPSEGTVRIGDEEFPAEEFQNRYRSQSDFDRAVQAQQRKLQAQLQTQYEQQYNQAMAQTQQQWQQWAQQVQMQQAQQGERPQSVDQILSQIRERTYTGPEDVEALINYIAPQLEQIQEVHTLRDQLNLMYGEMMQQRQGFEALQQERVSQATEKLIKDIQSLDSDVLGDAEGREVIMDILHSHEPAPGQTLDDFREEVQAVASKRMNWAFSAAKRKSAKEAERARKVAASGLPGSGGGAAPTGKAKIPMDPEEYAKMAAGMFQSD